MSHLTLPNPPSQTPLFKDLTTKVIKDLLREGAQAFRFLLSDTWSTWLTLLGKKLQPIVVKTTIDFPLTAAQSYSDANVVVTGADTDHAAEVAPAPAAIPAGACLYYAFVSAVGVVTIRFINASAAPINPASAEFTIVVRN